MDGAVKHLLSLWWLLVSHPLLTVVLAALPPPARSGLAFCKQQALLSWNVPLAPIAKKVAQYNEGK